MGRRGRRGTSVVGCGVWLWLWLGGGGGGRRQHAGHAEVVVVWVVAWLGRRGRCG